MPRSVVSSDVLSVSGSPARDVSSRSRTLHCSPAATLTTPSMGLGALPRKPSQLPLPPQLERYAPYREARLVRPKAGVGSSKRVYVTDGEGTLLREMT